MSKNDIIERLRQNPGSIAQEVGCTPVEMNRLYDNGLGPVVKTGLRKTGQRGRPPVEWALKESIVSVKDEGPKDTLPPVGAPKLPEVSPAIRAALEPEHARALAHIEKVFAGRYGQRKLGDYKILHGRYKEILRYTSRRTSRSIVVPVEDEVLVAA